MRILLINPNTSTAMTADMVRSAQAVEPEAEIVGVTATHGVAAIDGNRDDVLAAAAVVDAIASHAGGFDAAVLHSSKARAFKWPEATPVTP